MTDQELAEIRERCDKYETALENASEDLFETRISLERYDYTDLSVLLTEIERLKAKYERTEFAGTTWISSSLCDVITNKLDNKIKDLRNELCLKCGKYREAHNGACDGCRWVKKNEQK